MRHMPTKYDFTSVVVAKEFYWVYYASTDKLNMNSFGVIAVIVSGYLQFRTLFMQAYLFNSPLNRSSIILFSNAHFYGWRLHN